MKLGLDLIKAIQDKDHWEELATLEANLNHVAQNIGEIHRSLDMKDVRDHRQALASNLAKVGVLVEIARMKLSVMDGEWNERVAGVLEDCRKEYIKESFEDMEF